MNVKRATLFDGTELRVSMFESTPAKTDHRDQPFDIDEFVYVLSGKLILTETDGTAHEYLPGGRLSGARWLYRYLGNAGQLPRARCTNEKMNEGEASGTAVPFTVASGRRARPGDRLRQRPARYAAHR